MKHFLNVIGSLMVLLVFIIPTFSATIDVGHHRLLEDTSNQQVPIWISGDELVAGMNFVAQIGDGSLWKNDSPIPPMLVDSPIFMTFEPPLLTPLDLQTETIWSALMVLEVDPTVTYAGQLLLGGVMISEEVLAEGLLATMYIDTTGFFHGDPKEPWDLSLIDTLGGDTAVLDARAYPQPIVVNPGTIRLIPIHEQSTVAMLAIGVLLFGVANLLYKLERPE